MISGHSKIKKAMWGRHLKTANTNPKSKKVTQLFMNRVSENTDRDLHRLNRFGKVKNARNGASI